MISIVIPTYNRAKLVPRAIDSVINQTVTDWELIIVDDGSTDQTQEIISGYLKDTRIRYVKKDNSGAAHARNVGVQYARSEWITFLDSDDEAKPEWLRKFIDEINKGHQIILCGMEKYNEKGVLIQTTIPRQSKGNLGGQFIGGVYVLKKKIFENVGGFDPDLRSGQHTELWFRVKRFAVDNKLTTHIISEPLVKIHIHTGYRIRSDHRAKYEGSLYTYRKHYNDALKTKKMRSLFEGLIAYNAFKIKKYNTAIVFGFKSLLNRPSKKGLGRLARYILRIN